MARESENWTHDSVIAGNVTLAVPFYRNCAMLRRQIEEWNQYPEGLRIIVVDDGSPEPARPIIEACASSDATDRIQLYRILVDVPWNREEARNLAAVQCSTDWLIQTDIDHVLPADSAVKLLEFSPASRRWYRFPRWRKGKADETRQKDAIAKSVEFGQIKAHIDSYLINKDVYWLAGGYDLAFSGCLGGGTDFLKRLTAMAEPLMLPESICLHVYTRSEVHDASDWSLSRDRAEGKRRAKLKQEGKTARLQGAVISPWERQL